MAIGHMDMAVNQKFRFVSVHEIHQGRETPVGLVFVIAKTFRCRVGYHDVHALHAPQLPAKLGDAPAHLFVGILVGTGMVFPAASQAQNPDTVVGDDMTIDTVTALRRCLFIGCIVIAVDIQHRAFRHGYQKT